MAAISKLNFLSRAIGMSTNITVVVPSLTMDDVMYNEGRGIEWTPGMKFQVLYLLHGGNCDDISYLVHTNIARYADENKIVVVMPSGYLNRYTDHPGFGQYFQYIVEELPQVCKTMYPISDKREDTFIGGFSMGAAGSLKAGLLYPQNYAGVLAMSGNTYVPVPKGAQIGKLPKPFVADDAELFSFDRLQETVREQLKNGVELPKLYFSWGENDHIRERDKRTADFMCEMGLDPFVEVIPEYRHEWRLWDEQIKRGLYHWLPLKRAVMYP